MQRYGDILKELILKDNRYYVLTAENMGPIYYIMDDIKDNYLDVGIAEQTMVGVAAGLALRGRVPVVHAMASFLLMRAFEFIRTDIGYGKLNVTLVGTAAGFLSEKNGATHQSVEDIALMHCIPDMHIYAPADNDDMIKMERAIMEEDNACYLRYNDTKSNYEHEPFSKGKAEIIGDGADYAIITYGIMFSTAMKVKEMLEAAGNTVTLVNLRSIVPWDEQGILNSIKDAGHIVVIEDHLAYGGVSTMLSELMAQKGIVGKLHAFNLRGYFKPGSIDNILAYEKLSAGSIYDSIIGF